MSIASVMFVGSKSHLARCAIFQETTTAPHLLVNHGIYYQAGDNPMFKKTDDYDHVIQSSTSCNEEEKVSDQQSLAQQQLKQQPKQPERKQQPNQQQPMQQPKQPPKKQPPESISLSTTLIGYKQPHTSQDEQQQQGSDKTDVPQLNPLLPTVPVHVPSIGEIADCKDLVNFINKDGNKVFFYNVFDFGAHHHMNELYKIFVRNVSLCAFVIDSSGGINYEIIEKYRNFSSKGVIIVLKSDMEPSVSGKVFEKFPEYLIQNPQSHVFSISPKESDQEVGADILSQALSIPQKFPFSWYLFGFKLRMFMISNHRSTMSVSKEAMIIAEKLKLNRPTVEVALEHLTENNIILYFKNDTVFLSVHMFSRIISELHELHKSAMVNTSDLHSATAMYQSDDLAVDGFISLFIKLMILSPCDNVNDNVQYLVPNLLTHLDEDKRKEIFSDSDIHPVYFNCPSIGYEFITMLTVFLLTHPKRRWKLHLDQYQKPKCLHKNCVQFTLEDISCMVTLSFFNGYITVYAKSYGELVPTLNDIPTMIIQGLEKIKVILNSHKTFNFNMSFECTCGRYDAIYDYKSGFLTCENEPATSSPSTYVYRWIGTCIGY